MMHFAQGIEVVQATMVDLLISSSHACGTLKQSSTPLKASQKMSNRTPATVDKEKDEAGATAQVAGVDEAREYPIRKAGLMTKRKPDPQAPHAREEDSEDWNPLSSPGAEDWLVGDTIDGMAIFSNFSGESGSSKGVVVEFMDQKW